MRNFLLGILFTLACAWIVSAGYYAYACIDAKGSRWSWMPMSMGFTEYKQQLDSVTSCAFDHVESLLGHEAVHYYFNFPSLIIGLAIFVLLIRTPSRANNRKTDKLNRDDVRQRARRRL